MLLRRNIAVDAETAQLVAATVQPRFRPAVAEIAQAVGVHRTTMHDYLNREG